MTDREAFEAWAKSKGAPFYYEKIDTLPEDFNESAWRIWQAAKATGPRWHDAPTVPGLWFLRHAAGVEAHMIEQERLGETMIGDWYGPVPEDKP